MTAQDARPGGRHCASERGAFDVDDPYEQHHATAKLLEVARMDSRTATWLAELMGWRKAA